MDIDKTQEQLNENQPLDNGGSGSYYPTTTKLQLAKPNMFKQFVNYAATISAIAVWEQMPEFNFTNQQHQQTFTNYLLKSDFYKLVKVLEGNLSRYGTYALGIGKVVKIGKPILIQYDDENTLTELVVAVKNINKENINYVVLEKYNLVQKYIQTATVRQTDLAVAIKLDKINEIKFSDSDNLNTDSQIPWIILENNANDRADMADIDPQIFKIIDDDFEAFHYDTKSGKPFYTVDEQLAKQFTDAMNEPSKSVISVDSLSNLRGIPPAQVYQGAQQSQSTINQLNFIFAVIKGMAFLPKDSNYYGTKQLTIDEVNNMNYDFDKYILEKINLREYRLLQFVNLWMALNKINDEVDVICYGSSKYNKRQQDTQQLIAQTASSLISKQQNNTDQQKGGN